jgi:peptidoglycan hydrolase CwlO-like protein
MQWLKEPSQSNVDNVDNVIREVSRHYRNKKKEYLKVKIEEFGTNSKIKNTRNLCRGINDLNKVYQPRIL